jgi:hypothetical protein
MRRVTQLLFVCLLPLGAQSHKVDSAVRYHRLIAVVPIVGNGSHANPFRPQYAPAAATRARRTGIIAYSHVLSDDKKTALVEFVALQPSAFQAILADKSVKSFRRGQAKKEDVDKELKKYKRDFDINRFGVVLP